MFEEDDNFLIQNSAVKKVQVLSRLQNKFQIVHFSTEFVIDGIKCFKQLETSK